MSNEQLLKQVREAIEYLKPYADKEAQAQERAETQREVDEGLSPAHYLEMEGASNNCNNASMLALRFMEKMLGEPSDGENPIAASVRIGASNQALEEIK